MVSSPTQYYWYRSTLQSSSSVNEPGRSPSTSAYHEFLNYEYWVSNLNPINVTSVKLVRALLIDLLELFLITEIFNWNVALALIAAWFLIYMCMVRITAKIRRFFKNKFFIKSRIPSLE